jgi:two-component system, chemotaxis family, response regulator Rcp1
MNGNVLKPIEILLVEDNIGDIRLTEEALKESNLLVNLHVARDGMEAMEFLRGEGDQANAPAPDLILLDLNLPRKDGREVLQEIKNDADLKHIPVVVLTTSESESDIIATTVSMPTVTSTNRWTWTSLSRSFKCLKSFGSPSSNCRPGASTAAPLRLRLGAQTPRKNASRSRKDLTTKKLKGRIVVNRAGSSSSNLDRRGPSPLAMRTVPLACTGNRMERFDR